MSSIYINALERSSEDLGSNPGSDHLFLSNKGQWNMSKINRFKAAAIPNVLQRSLVIENWSSR